MENRKRRTDLHVLGDGSCEQRYRWKQALRLLQNLLQIFQLWQLIQSDLSVGTYSKAWEIAKSDRLDGCLKVGLTRLT